ncbi:hypothetical protein P154DRAFT_317200 [Amniculicola lignicola CBS 123094]|uniref:Uncharacterized protein n=1 Tax=Amniculicola lignicola CBS 123094 TaxID=1392246 RepID=A0A6A5WX53_9PLEO|nr:hypothetical protein P154DRAFT_317200 [Amniculicola lignicola CBS 123094]
MPIARILICGTWKSLPVNSRHRPLGTTYLGTFSPTHIWPPRAPPAADTSLKSPLRKAGDRLRGLLLRFLIDRLLCVGGTDWLYCYIALTGGIRYTIFATRPKLALYSRQERHYSEWTRCMRLMRLRLPWFDSWT